MMHDTRKELEARRKEMEKGLKDLPGGEQHRQMLIDELLERGVEGAEQVAEVAKKEGRVQVGQLRKVLEKTTVKIGAIPHLNPTLEELRTARNKLENELPADAIERMNRRPYR
jgi:hypothetical protein